MRNALPTPAPLQLPPSKLAAVVDSLDWSSVERAGERARRLVAQLRAERLSKQQG